MTYRFHRTTRSRRYDRFVAGLVMCFVCVSLAGRVAATVVYGDTEFAPGDWTEQVFYTSGNGGTGSAIQLLAGGNPGACRRVTHNIGGRPAQVALAHEFTGATYDPQS